ncbi:MAG: plastocyanin/azurin family copper-binding protein [Bdellovibrionota bacterium]
MQVQPGDQVDFVPIDMGHNTQSVVVPEQAQPWQSKTDEKISIKLIQEGVYVYQCSNHQIMGMVGVIQVGTPTNLSKAQAFAKQWQTEVVMNKQRLDDYLQKIK